MKQKKWFVMLLLLAILTALAGCTGEIAIDCNATTGMRLSDIPVSVIYDENALEHSTTWYIRIDGQRYALTPEDVLGKGQYELEVRYTLPEESIDSAEEAEVILHYEGGEILKTQVLDGTDRLTVIQYSFDEGDPIPESLKKAITIRSTHAAVDTPLEEIDLSVLHGEEVLEYTAGWYVDRDGEWYKLASDDYLGSGTYELRIRYTLSDVLGGENGEGLSVSVACGTGEAESTHVANGSVCTTVIRFHFEDGCHFCNHAASASSPITGICTEGLSYTGTCYKCGDEVEEFIPPQAHALDVTAAATVAPTCVDEGHRTGPCRICGETCTAIIPATGIHNDWRSQPIGKCPEGVHFNLHCHTCGRNAVERLPPQDHRYRCTGALNYQLHMWICATCGDLYLEGHNFGTSGRCSVCGYAR